VKLYTVHLTIGSLVENRKRAQRYVKVRVRLVLNADDENEADRRARCWFDDEKAKPGWRSMFGTGKRTAVSADITAVHAYEETSGVAIAVIS